MEFRKSVIFLAFSQLLLCRYACSMFEGFVNSDIRKEKDSSVCRQELNAYHDCLENALEKTRLNRSAVDIGVRECFEDNQCTVPNFEVVISANVDAQREAANRRLQQTPFKNVDAATFEQCKVTVNTKARDRIRACVAIQIPTFAPGVDEDVNDDGEIDGEIERKHTLGSYAISKLAESQAVCGDSHNRNVVKSCVVHVFEDNQPNLNTSTKIFNEYCSARAVCKSKLSPPCANQLNQTHRLLCQCSIEEVGSSKGDSLRDEFLDCTKVDEDKRESLALTIDVNPHRAYASAAFCHAQFEPCSWLWRQLTDETSSDTSQMISDESAKMEQHGHGITRALPLLENKTEGQLGTLLSSGFNQHEIRRLFTALNSFSNPNNYTVTDRSELTNEELVSDLVSRMVGNNSEGEHLAEIGSHFFGFERSNGSEAPLDDLETLTTRIMDPETVERLTKALDRFMYPHGNESRTDVPGDKLVEGLISDAESQAAGEANRILNAVNHFQNPSASELPLKEVTAAGKEIKLNATQVTGATETNIVSLLESAGDEGH